MLRTALKFTGTLADQVLSAGAVLLVNVVLARSQTAEAYGVFALTYSLYTFLTGLHNGVLLDAFTVYGSGRYREKFGDYWRFAYRANILVSGALSLVVLTCAIAAIWFPRLGAASNYVALAAVLPILLTSLFVRRVTYVEGRPVVAGLMATVFFVLVAALLFAASRGAWLTGVSALFILAVGWLLSFPVFHWGRPAGDWHTDFRRIDPDYVALHWQYSKWILLTALIFQLSAQGYFWIAALALDTTSVAELRAAYNIALAPMLAISSLSLVMIPRFARLYQKGSSGKAGMNREVLTFAVSALLLGVVCAVAAWGFGEMAYDVAYRGKYNDSLPIFYVTALVPMVMGIGAVFVSALKAVEKPRLIYWSYLVGGFLTLAVGTPAILRFGVSGAAWGMVASNAGFAVTAMAGYFWVTTR